MSRYVFLLRNEAVDRMHSRISDTPEYRAAYNARGDVPYGTGHSYAGSYWNWYQELMVPAIERLSGLKVERRWTPIDKTTYDFSELVDPAALQVVRTPKVVFTAPSRIDTARREEIEQVCQEALARYLERNVVVETPPRNCYCRDVSDRGYFRLVLHSGAGTSFKSQTDSPVALEGVPLNSREYWLKPSGKGVALSIDSHVVGELIGEHTLFVHPDIVSASPRVTRDLLMLVIVAASGHIAKLADSRDELTKKLRQRSRSNLGSIAAEPITGLTSTLRTEVATLEKDVAALNRELIDKMRDVRNMRGTLVALQRPIPELVELGGTQYDRLIEHPLIEAVAVRGTTLVVHTKTIVIKDVRSGKSHEIGRFMLSFHMNDRSVSYNFVNKDRTIQSVRKPHLVLHHPHIHNPEGQPCLGTIEESLPDLLANHEYAEAIYLALDFLSSAHVYERNGTGPDLEYFPEYVEPETQPTQSTERQLAAVV